MSSEFFKRRLKRALLDWAARWGYDVERRPGTFPPYRLLKRLTLGVDAFADVRTILGGDIRCVFDVGANEGQTATKLLDSFPRAQIYSFEPHEASFAELSKLADASPRLIATQAAVGDAAGTATFFVNKASVTNSLLKPAPGSDDYLVQPGGMDSVTEVRVPVVTLDGFCAARSLARIDLLKLDVQGFEIRALEGARELLSSGSVTFVYLEVSFVPTYEQQPLFPEVYQYLFDRGYRLVWLYETGFHTHFYSLGANGLFVMESIGARRPRQGSQSPFRG